jgi:hypothetical protein
MIPVMRSGLAIRRRLADVLEFVVEIVTAVE